MKKPLSETYVHLIRIERLINEGDDFELQKSRQKNDESSNLKDDFKTWASAAEDAIKRALKDSQLCESIKDPRRKQRGISEAQSGLD